MMTSRIESTLVRMGSGLRVGLACAAFFATLGATLGASLVLGVAKDARAATLVDDGGASGSSLGSTPQKAIILHLANGTEVSGVIEEGGFDEANGVKLVRDDNGGSLALRWDQIIPEDVDAIKRLYGFVGDDAPPITVRALMLHCTGNRDIVGIDGGRQANGYVLFKKGVPTTIPFESILSRENVVVDALEVLSPAEAFEQVRREQPPKEAVDYYNLGLKAEALTLYDQAKECFESALKTDANFAKKDVIEQRKKILDAKAKESDAAEQLRRIRALRLQKDFAGSLKLVDDFMKKWPASAFLAEVQKEQKNLNIAFKEDLLNQIRSDFLPIVRELCIKKALDAEVELGPAMNWAEQVAFGEALKILTKRKGIKDEAEAFKLWQERGKYGSATPVSYGGGTFILGAELARKGLIKGEKDDPKQGGDSEKAKGDSGKPLTLEQQIQKKLKEREDNAKKKNAKQKTLSGSDLADVPPTPEDWYKTATTTDRASFLFAFFGEHAQYDGKKGIIIVERVTSKDCSECGGQGIREFLTSGAQTKKGGTLGETKVPCTRCKKLTFDRIVHIK